MSEIKTVEGVVKLVEETKEYGEKGFKKRVMIVDVQDGQYTQSIPIEAVQDKCGLFDGIDKGDNVTAFVNLRGSEWKNRYFLSLQCWKIDVEGKEHAQDDAPQIPDLPPDDASGVDSDSIPF